MYQFKFADIGEGVHEGTVLKWMFKVGDTVKDGDSLCLIETDKVNAEIPSPVDGKIVKIMAEVGEVIMVGEVLVTIDDGSESTTAEPTEAPTNNKKQDNDQIEMEPEEKKESSGVVGEIEVSSDVIENSVENNASEVAVISEKVLATPVARKLAKDLGININTIKGSGNMGRIMKDDIYQAKDAQESSSKPKTTQQVQATVQVPELKVSGDVERIPLTKMRKTIAQNMVLSKTVIPHASTMDEYDLSKLVQFRKDNKALVSSQGVNLTYMPFIIKAVTLTLKDYPMFNSSYDEINQELVIKKYYNMGIAVDTKEGLMVPVIKNADKKSIIELAKELEQISTEARDRTIKLDKLTDGTFTITNYGAFGSTYGVPVIKHPEVAIIGIGKIAKKPVVEDDQIVIREMMPVSISIDHRVIDGADAGRFLLRLKEYLNNPMLLLLS
jgi:pyruvate dehydrogenase E2 component (dihydrolipoamide acetyltransferase)